MLSGFRLETDQTARVVDVLALGAASTNTSVGQLGAALAKAAPSAAAAGWSLEEVTAAIGKLSDAGIQGEEAGTALKTMMAKLAIDGGPAEKLMAKMGITVKDTAGQMLPLNDILAALAPHADNVGLQMELLGTRGGNAGLVLGAVAQDAALLTTELENAEGAGQKMADTMSGGLWGSMKSIQSIVESAYISFGERLAPILQTVATLFGKLPAPIQEVVVVAGSLVGAMGGLMLIMPQSFGALVQFPGKLLTLAKTLKITATAQWLLNAAIKGMWRALAGPVGLVIALGALLLSMPKVRSAISGFITKGLEPWRKAIAATSAAWTSLTDKLKNTQQISAYRQAWGMMTETFWGVEEGSTDAAAAIVKLGGGIVKLAPKLPPVVAEFDTFTEAVVASGEAAGDWVTDWTAAYKEQIGGHGGLEHRDAGLLRAR